jgi:glycosyltransferase involved in cell wall biosynthesis
MVSRRECYLRSVMTKKILFLVTEDWYFVSHRLYLAKAAIASGYRVALLTRVTRHREVIEASGVEIFEWSIKRGSINPLAELRALKGVFAVLRHFRPNLVHAVALKPVLYAAIACRLTGVEARVFALGGVGFVFSSQKFLARLLRPLLVLAFRWVLGGEHSRLILQNPDDLKTIVTKKVLDAKHIRLIRGAGVDTEMFSPKGEAHAVPLVVLPARMLWDKGVGEFVASARVLLAKEIAARFVLVGEPDTHNPECVSVHQIEAWVAEGVVEWWGHRNDMPDVLNQAAVVCLPSYREGLPKSLLEAASCARPIVAFDVPGCREVAVDGVNGFLVPFNDVGALATALEKLLGDADLRHRMGAVGRELVMREFSQEKVAAETLKIWAEVLA